MKLHKSVAIYQLKRTALNNGLKETSGFMSNTSGKIVKRESVKQLSTTSQKSISQAGPNMAAPMHSSTQGTWNSGDIHKPCSQAKPARVHPSATFTPTKT